MKKRTSPILAAILACGLSGTANAAAVFWSFDTQTDGLGSYATAISAIDGFASASSVTRTGTVQATNHLGGAAFTDFEDTFWAGSGGTVSPGHSLTWNGNSINNSFSVTLNTTGLESINIRLDVRSAGTSPLSAFSSLTYAIGGSEAVTIDTVDLTFATGSSFGEWSADLSSIVAINNQSSVTLTWNIATIPGGASLRVDNLQITAAAIPEPATLASVLGGAVALAVLCTKRRRASANAPVRS
ncbi:hypothetical protein OPIT5_15645 [Opitutaceae bacterium TAV5]|nr:hypothetical protein OPIT5_15645 [Opitutaceae bacterium TAV5]